MTDPTESLLVGCYTTDVKQTYFHQGCPTVIPSVVIKLAKERICGKMAAATWFNIVNLITGTPKITKMSDETWKEISSDSIKLSEWIFKKVELRTKDPKKPASFENLSSFAKRLFQDIVDGVANNAHMKGFLDFAKTSAANFTDYQDAVKRFMNSIYGVLYMRIGALSYMELSAVITSFGRQLLSLIRCIAERLTSDQIKTHKLCFNWSKKSLDKAAMEILFNVYRKECEKEGGIKNVSWTSEKAKTLAKQLLEAQNLNDGGEFSEDAMQKIAEIRSSISIQNFLDFVSTKMTVGLGFLRHVDNQLIAKLSENKLLKSWYTICSVYGDTVY